MFSRTTKLYWKRHRPPAPSKSGNRSDNELPQGNAETVRPRYAIIFWWIVTEIKRLRNRGATSACSSGTRLSFFEEGPAALRHRISPALPFIGTGSGRVHETELSLPKLLS